MGQFYEIVHIEPAEPPLGAKGSYWYRYVVAFEGRNSLAGNRQGSLKTVTREVKQLVDRLNEGHFTERGNVERTWK